jgi:predicted oxidoreductase
MSGRNYTIVTSVHCHDSFQMAVQSFRENLELIRIAQGWKNWIMRGPLLRQILWRLPAERIRQRSPTDDYNMSSQSWHVMYASIHSSKL